jgi:hypothetical protein
MLGCMLALAGIGTVPARAQGGGDSDLTRNWNLRAGFFIPERKSVRSAEGDVMFTIGAERAFYEQDRWRGTISIDYYGSGKVYNVPITINARYETANVRMGGGMGVGMSHDLTRGNTAFAWNLLLGYTLRQGANPVFADVRYWALSNGGDLNGWAFTLGFGF